MMTDLGKFWNEIKGLPKDEVSKRILEDYGDNPDILEVLKQILADKNDDPHNLKKKLDTWKIMSQV